MPASLAILRRWILSLGPRRKHARMPASLAVDWRAFGSRVHHVSELADLSPAGAFVRAADPRPVGSPIVLDVATHRGRLNLHARVAWTGPTGMGLRFTRAAALV